MFARVNLILATTCFAVAICVTSLRVARATGTTDCELSSGACVNQGCSGQKPVCHLDDRDPNNKMCCCVPNNETNCP
jgi:hypothetical protein